MGNVESKGKEKRGLNRRWRKQVFQLRSYYTSSIKNNFKLLELETKLISPYVNVK